MATSPALRAASQHPSVVVVGAAVLDVVSQSNKALLHSTSNPGVITMQVGGVGRNICEALVHLEVPALLIAPMGADPAALTIRQWCHANHMATEGLIEIAAARTPVYSALMNHESGELLYGVIDSAIFGQFTIQHISGAKWVVLDSNGSTAFLKDAVGFCRQLKASVFFEPVSVQKAQNIADPAILRDISIICPNVRELLSICHKLEGNSGPLEAYIEEGLKKEHIMDYRPCLSALLKAGVQTAVIVKLGPRGVLLGLRNATGIEYHSFAALKADVVNVLGAGDCLVAGIIYALVHGHSVIHAIRLGLIAAKLSVESLVTVPATLNLSNMNDLFASWTSLPRLE